MGSRPRAIVIAISIAAVGLGTLVLAGCSSEATGPERTLVHVEGTSFVVKPAAQPTTTLAYDPGTSVPEAVVTGITYTVVAGDSVFQIADRFEITPVELADFNKWREGVDHPLYQGDVILLPPNASGSPSDPPPQSGTTSNGGACPTTYTIAPEDTSRINVAAKFDLSYQELDAANTNTSGYASFLVGTVIKVPCPN